MEEQRTVWNKHLNIGKPLSVRPFWKLALKRLKNKFDWGHESINLKCVHHCCSRINWQCFIHQMKLSSINQRLYERICVGKYKKWNYHQIYNYLDCGRTCNFLTSNTHYLLNVNADDLKLTKLSWFKNWKIYIFLIYCTMQVYFTHM